MGPPTAAPRLAAMSDLNLAGRAGRWSADNWKKALFGWLIFAVAAMAIGSIVGHVQMRDSQYASGETAKAVRLLEHAGFRQPASEVVLIQSRTHTAADPIFISALAGVVQTLSLQQSVTGIQDPRVKPGGGGQISRDGHSVLVQFTIKGDPDKAKDKVKPILDAIAGVQTANPDVSVREVGNASANYELGKRFTKDFANAERLTIPITLIILLVSFGTLVAAGLPVLLAFSAVLASLGLYSLVTHAYPGDYQSTSSVVLLIGMAVGVDYSLFYLRREREERAAGREPRPALLRAASTSGQAVVISGATVLIAMAGMFIADNRIFTSMAIGTMLVVLCAVIGSVTVLAASLSKLGDRVDWGRIPFTGRRQHAAGESRFWGFVLDRVLRRPIVFVVAFAGLLLLCATPALNMHTKLPSFTDMPSNMPVVKTYKSVIAAFPGAPTPAEVVVHAQNVRTPAVAAAIRKLESAAVATGQMFQPILVDTSADGTVADVQIPLAGNGDDRASLAALTTLRAVVLPRTLGTVAGVDYAVAGETAGTRDFNQQMKSRMPWVIAFVLGLAFVLLLMTFRSVVIPLTAIAPEPALGRRGVRAARADLPAHVGGGGARLHLQQRDHVMAADVPVRRAVRPVDGLPRVHPQPDQGAARRRHGHRGGGLTGDPAHRRHGHERGDHHGRRLLDLRDLAADHDETARRRTRAGGADRRDGHPRRPSPGDDEAARRMELVHAAVARVAAVADAGADAPGRWSVVAVVGSGELAVAGRALEGGEPGRRGPAVASCTRTVSATARGRDRRRGAHEAADHEGARTPAPVVSVHGTIVRSADRDHR